MPAPRIGEPVPAEIAAATVLDPDGARVRVGSLWDEGPCLLVLLRHFGCVGCDAQMTELAPRLGELARAGVRTVVVGNGSREQLGGFVDRHALAGAAVVMATDPDRVLYRALSLRRSAWATLGPRALLETARALGAGHAHRRVQGDAFQQGGALLVDARGVARFFHANRTLGDHAPACDLVEAALTLEIESSPSAARV